MSRAGVHVRAGEYHGWKGFHVGGCFCRTRACAEYIRGLLQRYGFSEAFDRINRALVAELDPLTCFPPDDAGDVIGEVAS